MSEQDAQGVGVTTQNEISDEAFNQYFESGGNEETAAETSSQTEQSVDTQSQSEDQVKEDANTEQHNRNYRAAMHEERERRKELQRQVEEIKARNQRLEDTFQRVMYAKENQSQAQQEQQLYEEDPVNTLRARQDGLENFLKNQAYAYQQQQNISLAQQQFMNRYAESARAFASETPDFKEAYQHLTQEKLKEFKEAGYTDQAAVQLLHEDEMAFVINAYNNEANPAEKLYNLAKLRGYKPNGMAQHGQNQKMSQMERGIAASKSLSSTSDKARQGRMSLQDIANLSDQDFAKVDWGSEVVPFG